MCLVISDPGCLPILVQRTNSVSQSQPTSLQRQPPGTHLLCSREGWKSQSLVGVSGSTTCLTQSMSLPRGLHMGTRCVCVCVCERELAQR